MSDDDTFVPAMILGIDIGGANLKAAHENGVARTRPFALWRDPAGLADALRTLLADMPTFEILAVTMTGELCDCFATKREGVLAILAAVEHAAPGVDIRVWTTAACFATPGEVRRGPLSAAAANWLALASFAGRCAADGLGLLVDVGSTTTDIVLIKDGRPQPRGLTDPERLGSGELVYTGSRRTPLCAILGEGHAAEFFATTLDAYLVLGLIAENDKDCATADDKPATRPCAHVRLARMLCGDGESIGDKETLGLASLVAARQEATIRAAAGKVLGVDSGQRCTLILSGSGEFLARRALQGLPWQRVVSLAAVYGPEIAEAACAYAVAMLAREQS